MGRWPDFFLVGAPKSATGSIHEALGSDPRVFLAPKDLYFFGADLATTQPRLSPAEYQAQFEAAPEDAEVGDSSVGYLCSELAAREIHASAPAAKIAIALRNPLDAIPSLHQHCLYYGIEEIEDLGEALAAEPERARGERLPRRCAHPWMLRYTHVYRYADQVERYFATFGAERCHLVVYDDFRADPGAALGALRSFLGLSEGSGRLAPPSAPVNPARRARSRRISALVSDPPPVARRIVRGLAPRSLRRWAGEGILAANTLGAARPNVPPELRARLAGEFAGDVARVSELLGRDLGHWLRPERHAARTTG